ncbi:MAG: L-lactate permease [Anaerolineae bacterium]|nr:L-lactate permease [Anaerolineae bacterium]
MQFGDILLALTPMGVVVVLMIGLRWKSARAGLAGWGVALLVASLRFGATRDVLFWAQVRGAFFALYVLYIIWGALLFYRVTEAAGTIQALSTLLQKISPNRALQILLLAWGFASFLQGVGGFGVPVAVVAPLLVGMGVQPLSAVVIPSLGHTWAVSFGSLGSSFEALRGATGLAGAVLAPASALYLGVVCFLMGAATLWAAGRGRMLKSGLAPLLLMGSAMAGGQWLAARGGLWSIAATLGALAGLLVGSGWALIQRRVRRESEKLPATLIRNALLPYGVLLVWIFAYRFIPALKGLLDSVIIRVQVPGVTTARGWVTPAGATQSISVFGQTGALLIYASLLIWLLYRRGNREKTGTFREVWQKVARSGVASTIGILSMVALATTMDHAGMITLLAQALADAAGAFFPLVAPFIGALGAFVTGSNTNANVLFGALQRDVAQTLGYVTPVILAAQNAGGAIGSTFAPAKVLVGCSTVGMGNREGDAMRTLIVYDVAALGVLAVVTWFLAQSR